MQDESNRNGTSRNAQNAEDHEGCLISTLTDEPSSLTLASEQEEGVEPSSQSDNLSQLQHDPSNSMPEEGGVRHHGSSRRPQDAGPRFKDQLQSRDSLLVSPSLMALMNQTFDPVIPASLTACGTSSRGTSSRDIKQGSNHDKEQTDNGMDSGGVGAHRSAGRLSRTNSDESSSAEFSIGDNNNEQQYAPPTNHPSSDRDYDHSYLPEARPVYEASVVHDRAEVEAQLRREILANVEEAQVVHTESSSDNNNRDTIHPESGGSDNVRDKLEPSLVHEEPKYGRHLRWCIFIFFATLAIALAVAFARCGTGLCLTDSPVDMPISSASASQKTWDSSVETIFPYSDQEYTEMQNGMFGAGVSVSDDGRRILVAFGEVQELTELRNRRRKLAVISGSAAAELLDCNATKCVKVADVARASFAIEGTLTTALSGDGSRIVIEYQSSFMDSGSLAVYSVTPTSGEEPIVKEQEFDVLRNTTYTVKLDSTGDTFVLLATELGGDATVFVYDSTAAEYQSFGDPIQEKADELPKVLSLSSSGSVVAIGSNVPSSAPLECSVVDWNAPLQNPTTVIPLANETVPEVISGIALRVYELGSDGDVLQIGSDILSSLPGVFASEEAMVLSGDGTIVAMAVTDFEYEVCLSAPSRCCNNLNRRGHVSVFRRSSTLDGLSSWYAMGSPLSGEEGEHFGESLSLSGDGQTLVVGAPLSRSNGLDSGRVLVYDYNSTLDQWVQTGAELLGSVGSTFGHTVSISKEGDTIVVGSPLDQRKGALAGAATVFRPQAL